jgi:hypothetical protein
MMDGLPTMLYRVLVPGLASRGAAPGGHLITCDAAARRRVISLLVRMLICGVPLVAETLLEAWFHHWI